MPAPIPVFLHGARHAVFDPTLGIHHPPIGPDGALEFGFPRLIERLDQIDVEAVFLGDGGQGADEWAASATLAAAGPRWRPRVGQPDSPIRMGLPGNAFWMMR